MRPVCRIWGVKTDKPRRRPFLAALAAALSLFAAAPAAADVLVSNIGQSRDGNTTFFTFDLAQAFTTGSNAGGYTLTSVDVQLVSASASDLRVRVVTGTPDGTTLATLTNPSSLAAGNVTFTAPAGTTLAADTTYVLVMDTTQTGAVGWTTSDNEDSGGSAGWSVSNQSFRSGASSWASVANALLIRVNGANRDLTAPSFASATVNGTALKIEFDENLAAAANLANSAFTVKKTPTGGMEENASLTGSPSISGKTVSLTLAAAAVSTDAFTVAYTKPTAGTNNRLRDAQGNETDSFGPKTVTNLTPVPTPSLPVGCNTGGTLEPFASVSSTANSISATFKDPMPSGYSESASHAMSLCFPNSDNNNRYETQQLPPTTSPAAGTTWTITGELESFLGTVFYTLAAETDYWISFGNSYGNRSKPYYIRTKAESAFPVSLALNSAGDDNTYHNGDIIEVTATFAETVTVTGSPRIPIAVGANTRHAAYHSGSGGTELKFRYTVVTADVDADGIAIAQSALELNGGTINAGGTAAELGHAAVAANAAHKVDGGAASVSAVEFTSKPAGNYLTIGNDIEVTVTFDRPVTVTGAPRLELSPAFGYNAATETNDVVRHATYSSGSGGTALVFKYTLVDEDDSGGTNVTVAANALELNGGTIRTGTANAALAHTATADSGKTVSVKRPRIVQVGIVVSLPSVDTDLDGRTETYAKDDDISVGVSFDRDIAITGQGANIKVVLTIGGTDYTLAGGRALSTKHISFDTHQVTATDADTDGITLKRDSSGNVVRLSGAATIKGALGGNAAVLTLDADPKVTRELPDGTVMESLNVRGANAAPTASDFTVVTPGDTTYTFAASDFAFSDADNDLLKEIQIVSLPASGGALKLSGAAIASGDLPKTVANADIANLTFEPTSGFEGNAAFTFKAVDTFGAVSAAAATATVRVGASVGLAFNSAGSDGVYALGDTIEITATFANSVTVGGTPRIPFTIGSTVRHATFHGARTGTAITFRYTVAAADEDTDGIAVAANALQLNGGTINLAGTSTAAALDHPAVAANAARKVDGVRPTVSSLEVSSDAGADDTYAIGDAISLKATFSENVTVTSSGGDTETWPRIAFRLGSTTKQAVYASGSGTKEIVFSYTVAAGDADTNGIHVQANQLRLNGGAIEDGAGNDAVRNHTAVAADTDHKVDGVAPRVTSVAVSSSAGTDRTYAIGDAIRLRARFSENVTVASSGADPATWPRIAFLVGTETRHAVYESGTGTRDIVFSYTVAAGDADTDGIAVEADKLELDGGTIVDGAGNPAALTHSAVAANANHKVDGGAPTVSSLAVSSNAGADNTYAIGDAISLKATFSENVTVTNSGGSTPTWPRIEFTLGTAAKHAVYHSGSGSAEIVFRYTVAAGDEDTDGIAVAADKLELNGGAIKDGAGNDAALSHTAVAASTDHLVDGVHPTVQGTPSIDGTQVRIVFSEALHTGLPAASRFSVKLDGAAQALAGTNPVAISGSTVTLTLASAPGAGSLTVDYTKLSSGIRLRDAAGNEADSFAGVTVASVPVVTTATLQGTSLKITFNQDLMSSSLPAASAFTVKLGTAVQALAGTNPVAISGKVVTLTLAAAPAAGTVTVDYTKPTSGALAGTNGKEVEGFTGRAVARPATVESAATSADGSSVTITFTKTLNRNGAASAYAVTVGDDAQTPTNLTRSGKVLTLALGTAVTAGQTVTVAYAKPATATDRTLDADGLEIESFSGQTVSNVVPAAFLSATTAADGASVVVTFTADLQTPLPAESAFTVAVAGTNVTPSGVSLSDADLTLTLPTGTKIIAGQTVTVTYRKPAAGTRLTDGNGREVPAFSGESVTNAVPLTVTGIAITSDPGPDDTYQGGDTIRVTLTFSAPATVTGTPRLKFRFRSSDPDAIGTAPHLLYESGSGTDRLVFAYTVSSTDQSAAATGIGIPANRLQLNGGTIKAGGTDATLTHTAIAHGSGHRVDGPTARDTTPPALHATTRPAVNGNTLTVTFDDNLDEAGTAPAASAFTVKVGGTAVDLAATGPVTISGAAVTLTLASAVIDADRVTVAYDKPADNPIRNLAAGLEAESFGDTAATNNTPGAPPTVSGTPAVSGATLVINFSEPLDTGSEPAPGAFTVTVGGANRTVSDVDISGARVTLTLQSAAVFGETVTVSYAKPATNPLRDRAATPNAVADFGPLNVTNNDATAPSFSSASVNGNMLTITFDENLDQTSRPATDAFTVTVGGANRDVTNVAISGAAVTLTLASAVRAADGTVMVRYTKPAGASAVKLQDGALNEVATFGNQRVTNNTPLTVTGVTVSAPTAADGFFGGGERIVFSVAFSEAVTVTGAPRIAFTLGTGTNTRTAHAAYASGSGSAGLMFRYAVAAGDSDTDGITVGANALDLNGGTIRAGSKAADLAHDALTGLSNRLVNGDLIRSDPPVARAGPDRAVNPGARVTLSGSGTDPDGTVQSYDWSQVSGTSVTLQNAGTAQASFTAPETAGALVFRLTVTDNDGVTDSDDVTVTVRDAPPRFVSRMPTLRLKPGEAMTPVVLPAATGGNGGPYIYGLSSEPAGLAGLIFDDKTRTLSGTPNVERGRFTFTYWAHDDDDNFQTSDAARLTFQVVVGLAPEVRRRAVKRTVAAVAARTVAGAVANIGTRLGDAVPGASLTVAGESVPVAAGSGASAALPNGAACPSNGSGLAGFGAARLGRAGLGNGSGNGFGRGFGQAGAGNGFGGGFGAGACAGARSRGVDADALWRTSAFSLPLGAAAGDKEGEPGFDPDAPRWSVWGRGDFGAFAGRPERGMRYKGETRTGWLGVDARGSVGGSKGSSGRWVAGLAVSHGTSEADYSFDGGDDPAERGRLETRLSALWPYGRWTFANGLELRGMLGAGTGRLRHEPGDGEPAETSRLTMWTVSLGLRRKLPPLAGIALAMRGDASFARIASEGGGETLDGLRADIWRGRIGLEGSRRFALDGDAASLTPFLEAAARQDGGDGVTGTGLELAGGLRYAFPGTDIELRGRWLAAHTQEGTEERGVSLTVRMLPQDRGRGLSLSLSPRWGAGTGRADALWREDLPKPGASAAAREAGALDLRVGYGFGLLGDRFTGTPNAGFGFSDNTRDYRIGWRLTSAMRGDPGFRVDLDATRSEPAGGSGSGAKPQHGIMLQGSVRW